MTVLNHANRYIIAVEKLFINYSFRQLHMLHERRHFAGDFPTPTLAGSSTGWLISKTLKKLNLAVTVNSKLNLSTLNNERLNISIDNSSVNKVSLFPLKIKRISGLDGSMFMNTTMKRSYMWWLITASMESF